MIHEAIERQIRGACPLGCPDTCSWIVTVKNGEMATLRGDPAHPYTPGALCNKVVDCLTYARSSDRLLYPMRRTGPKGSGQFTRISWDEALERKATELSDTITKYGRRGDLALRRERQHVAHPRHLWRRTTAVERTHPRWEPYA